MRTRATLRSAEFGFFGVVVYTRVHTPRRWGAATFFLRPLPDLRPGVDSFLDFGVRPLRTSWLVVGMRRVMVAKSGRPPRAGGRTPARVTSWYLYAELRRHTYRPHAGACRRRAVGAAHVAAAARGRPGQICRHATRPGGTPAPRPSRGVRARAAAGAGPGGPLARRR